MNTTLQKIKNKCQKNHLTPNIYANKICVLYKGGLILPERWELKQMQSLPLELKIIKTQLRVREWYDYWNGNVYISYSGGKDSSVLRHIVRDMYSDVPSVFVDTGLEYPEVRNCAKKYADIILRPKMRFDEVIKKYGYPVISKEQSAFISEVRHSKSQKLIQTRLNGNKYGRGKISKKWVFLIDSPFEISDKCCDIMKKAPLKDYETKTNNMPMIATMTNESAQRQSNWLMYGCNAFDAKKTNKQTNVILDRTRHITIY